MHDEEEQGVPQAEAGRFLERDFNQCFTQMRHYDGQMWNICKFTFTAYAALIGISVGLYKYSVDKAPELVWAAVAALCVGALFGFFMFCLAVRNRVYYVLVTRYINEHRRHFLRQQPLGFQNATRMYTNPRQPPYFNWRSTQSWFLYLIAALNAFLLGTLVVVVLPSGVCRWLYAAVAFVAVVAAQLITAVCYLKSREPKSASQAVFGQD